MGITAKEIQEQGFEHSRKGYDIDEVDEFLEHVATEVDGLNRRIQDLEGRLADAQEMAQQEAESTKMISQPAPISEDVSNLTADLAAAQARIEDLESQLKSKTADSDAISAAIISAQKSAEQIRNDAREEGKKIYSEAEEKSREIIREALASKQKTMNELDKLKDARDRFQAEYFALLKRFEEAGESAMSDDSDDQADAAPAAPAPQADETTKSEPVEDAKPASYAEYTSKRGRYADVPVNQLHADVSSFGDTADDDIIDEID